MNKKIIHFILRILVILLCCVQIAGTPIINAAGNDSADTSDTQWYLHQIGLPTKDSDIPETKDTTVCHPVIAVIDTGILTTHPALNNSLWINEAEKNGIAGTDDDGNGYIDDIYGYNVRSDSGDITDTDGHGTHVSGIIAMKATEDNTAHGVCEDARIMTVKAGNSVNGFSSENLIKAIQYATANNADVINLSLGTGYCTDELRAAIEEASKHAVLVAAAGNGSSPTREDSDLTGDNIFPAALPDVIGVMSFNQNNELAWFSNWDKKSGTEVDYEIIAPGEEIYSTALKNTYREESGTSMSTAIVSAACGILIQEWYHFYGINENTETSAKVISPSLIRKCLLDESNDTISYTDSDQITHQFLKLNIENSVQQLRAMEHANPSDSDTEQKNEDNSDNSEISVPVSSDTEQKDEDNSDNSEISVPVSSDAGSTDYGSNEASRQNQNSEAALTTDTSTNTSTTKSSTTKSSTAKKIKKRKPKLKKKKTSLSFSIKGIVPDGWILYRSSKKKGTYRRYAALTKKRITIKRKSKTYYFYVQAYKKSGSKKYYSKKSVCVKIP